MARFALGRAGSRSGIGGAKVDDAADDGGGLDRAGAEARGPATSISPFSASARPHDQPSVRGFDMARSSATSLAKGKPAGLRGVAASASTRGRFSRARRPADQNRARADQHGGGVNGRRTVRVITSRAGAR